MNNPVQCPQCRRRWLIGLDGRTRHCDRCKDENGEAVRAVALVGLKTIEVSVGEAATIKRRFMESRIGQLQSRRRRRSHE